MATEMDIEPTSTVFADQRLGGRRRALIGDVHHVDAGEQLQQLGRQMRQRAGSRRRVVEVARLLLGVRDETAERVDPQIRPHHEDTGEGDELGDRHEIPERVVGTLS